MSRAISFQVILQRFHSLAIVCLDDALLHVSDKKDRTFNINAPLSITEAEAPFCSRPFCSPIRGIGSIVFD